MKLTVLGCGDAFGNGGRNNTAFLLTEEKEHILLDCGASTLIRLKQEKIALDEISTIVLSHFHGDHYGGVPFFLISSMFEKPRKKKLTIVGPKGVEQRILDLQEAMYPGTSERLSNLDIDYLEYESGHIQMKDVQVEAYSVNHSEPSIPHGIRLTWKNKIIAFSGDTSWTDNLIPLCKAADLFICECNFLDQQAYGHLSHKELLIKQSLLDCSNIWLTHMNLQMIESSDIKFNRLEDGMTFTF